MNEETPNHPIDPELEARIVALVLGEASDFERDELERLIEEQPELSSLVQQIRSVDGLLAEVGTGELAPADEHWKLPVKQRDEVLAVFNGTTTNQHNKPRPSGRVSNRWPVASQLFWNLSKIAAAFCIVGLFFGIAMQTFMKSSARVTVNTASDQARLEGPELLWDEAPASESGFDAKTSRKWYSTWERSEPATSRFGDHPDEALAAIRDNVALGYEAPDRATAAKETQRTDNSLTLSLPEEGLRQAERMQRPQVSFGVRLRSEADDDLDYDVESEGLIAEDFIETDEQIVARQKATPIVTGIVLPDTSDATELSTVAPQDKSRPLGRVDRFSDEQEPSAAPKPQSQRHSRHYAGMNESPSVPDETSSFGRQAELDDRWTTGQPVEDAEFAGVDVSGVESRLEKYLAPREQFDSGLSSSTRNPSDASNRPFGFDAPGPDELASGLVPQYRSAEFDDGAGPSLPEDDEFVSAPSNNKGFSDAEQGGLGGGGFGSMGGGFGGRESWSTVTPAPSRITLDGEEATPMFGAIIPEPQSGLSDDSLRLGEAVKQKGEAIDKKSTAVEYEGRFVDPPNQPASRPESRNGVDGGFYYAVPTVPNQNSTQTDNYFDANDVGTNARGSGQKTSTASEEFKSDAQVEVGNDHVAKGVETQAQESLDKISKFYSHLGNAPQPDIQRFDDFGVEGEQQGLEPKRELKEKAPALLGGTPLVASDGYALDQVDGGVTYWSRTSKQRGIALLERRQLSIGKSPAFSGLNELTAQSEPFSTFSLHVSDVSFKLARTALAKGEWPEAARIRIEEFVNAFDYGDPMPTNREKVACQLEQCIHPFLQQRNLLRVSMRTAAAGRTSSTPLRLTLLLDNSGSMERADRQQTVRRAFALLAQQLKPIDRVTLISFARQPRLLAENVSGDDALNLVRLVKQLPSEGGTNMEAALQLAFEKAKDQHAAGCQNRVVLLTDGAVNLGNADPTSLSQIVTLMRTTGIAFDAAGIIADGLNDEVLETLTRKGDGRYYLLASAESADDGFARQIAGALRPAAKNVKVQIEFNPKRVDHYKLLGFEKHRLKKEDFRNDKVDAAEMAAAEAGVAMYQFEAKPDGEGDVGSVSVRFRDLTTGRMVEHCWPIPYVADASRPEQANPSMRIASSAALLAAKLRDEPLGDSVDLKSLANLVAGLPSHCREADRVQELSQMIEKARELEQE